MYTIWKSYLERTRFNFREKNYIEDVTKIGKLVLTLMKYEIIDGKVIENPSNEKNRKVSKQEAPIDLRNFDYSIPQRPSTDDLLKVLIRNIYVINDKIYFIT